jgi:uncharacterized RDD family membrane protein YckC
MESTTPKLIETGKHLPLARAPHPAGFFSRSEAFIIDLVILSVMQLVGTAFIQTLLRFFKLTGLVTYLKTILENSTNQVITGSILLTLIVIGYYTFFWTLVGFTPGKAILGLKVVRKNGAKLSFGRSLLRFFSYWISAIPLFLGYFWVLWDPKRQAWHDKIAGTQVLYIPKNPSK